MEVNDPCAICRCKMVRGDLKRITPCKHLFHSTCVQQLESGAICPLCRGVINNLEDVIRKTYKIYNSQDRNRVIEYANKGCDWTELAKSLGIPYTTAYTWITKNTDTSEKRGGAKPRILNEIEINTILSWIEENSIITLESIKQKIQAEFNKMVSVSTISNTLHGKLYSVKCCHVEPEGMNIARNKEKRAEYVRALNEYIQSGKQVIYIDETNFNLFCRRKHGWSRIGLRAVQLLPSSRGPNIHLIGAVGTSGVIKMDKRRGPFRALDANEWMRTVLAKWEELGNELSELVVVCDNAPCHSKFEDVFVDSPAVLLRLGPYSPQLNPIEAIWSKVKSVVKSQMEIPNVNPPNIGEQKLQYLEGLVDNAIQAISLGDCTRAIIHSSTFQQVALDLQDLPVGT